MIFNFITVLSVEPTTHLNERRDGCLIVSGSQLIPRDNDRDLGRQNIHQRFKEHTALQQMKDGKNSYLYCRHTARALKRFVCAVCMKVKLKTELR